MWLGCLCSVNDFMNLYDIYAWGTRSLPAIAFQSHEFSDLRTFFDISFCNPSLMG